MTASTNERHTIATTILDQLGGIQRLRAFINAQAVLEENALTLRFPRGPSGINHLRVVYNEGPDLYTMTFSRLRAEKLTVVKEYTEVYCDQLVNLFEETTGLFLHF